LTRPHVDVSVRVGTHPRQGRHRGPARSRQCKEGGGGAGIRTRVRKYILAGIYMRICF